MTVSRRHFLLGSVALPAFPAFAAKPAGEQPNIVLMIADGLGAWMLGCYGNKETRTPHIDSLAVNGTRALNHYAAAPVPAPGREALLTGGGQTAIDKVLGGAGYLCQTVSGGADAVKFIESQSAGKPFLLIVNFAPYEGSPDAKYVVPYAQANFDTWPHEPPAKNARNADPMGRDFLANLRKIAAATAAFDDQVGAISDAIAQKKLTDGTLMILTASCGSLFGAHGLWGDGMASDPVNMYEEVVNTPMVWMWPGRVPPRAVRPEMLSAIDLLPTACVIAGADLPSAGIAGRSYVSLGTGVPLPKKQPWKTTVFARYGNTAMARTDRYKLVLRDGGKGPGELYDDRTDPKERVNQYDNPQFLTVKNSLSAELKK